MRRLNKTQQKKLESLREQLSDAALAYNTLRDELEVFRDGILDDLNAYSEGRSDRWHESESGEAFAEWVGEWESECADEVDTDVHEYPVEVAS